MKKEGRNLRLEINICRRRRGGVRDPREEAEEECLELIKKNRKNRSAGQIDILSKEEC
jgi:hypothetical protein